MNTFWTEAAYIYLIIHTSLIRKNHVIKSNMTHKAFKECLLLIIIVFHCIIIFDQHNIYFFLISSYYNIILSDNWCVYAFYESNLLHCYKDLIGLHLS